MLRMEKETIVSHVITKKVSEYNRFWPKIRFLLVLATFWLASLPNFSPTRQEQSWLPTPKFEPRTLCTQNQLTPTRLLRSRLKVIGYLDTQPSVFLWWYSQADPWTDRNRLENGRWVCHWEPESVLREGNRKDNIPCLEYTLTVLSNFDTYTTQLGLKIAIILAV